MSDATYNTNQYMAQGTGDVRRQVVAKTADYTVTTADLGKIFTTTGAGAAVNFTLPAAADCDGGELEFRNVVDQNMVITGTGELVVVNDMTADTITFSTASQKIGAGVRVWSDGVSWFPTVTTIGTTTATVGT